MQSHIWASTIPLDIRHDASSIPYLVQVPRLSYLPFLLPRLNTFYGGGFTSFSYEGILLFNLPVGLLFDLHEPQLPWKLTLGKGPLYEMHDTFINSVKEADFIRNGTAKGIMSMSKSNTTQLWESVQDNDLSNYVRIYQVLLNSPIRLKHVPLRLYIPSKPNDSTGLSSFKTIQVPVSPKTASQEAQFLGSALNFMVPSLFPSRRDALIAEPILHGAPIPFHAPLEELMREAAYADGWLHVCIRILKAD